MARAFGDPPPTTYHAPQTTNQYTSAASCQNSTPTHRFHPNTLQVGWSLDGFPVYGPRGPGGTLMQTCTITGARRPLRARVSFARLCVYARVHARAGAYNT